MVEIAQHLGMKTPNVSPHLRILKEEGLLELVDAPGRQDFWAKKSIDRTLRISKYLCEAYNLKLDGRLDRGKREETEVESLLRNTDDLFNPELFGELFQSLRSC